MKEITHRFRSCFWDDEVFEYIEIAYCGEKTVNLHMPGEFLPDKEEQNILFSEVPSCQACEEAYALHMLGELP